MTLRVAAALVLLWLCSFAGTFPFAFDYPDTNVDGTPLTDLHHAEMWLFRCPYDSLRLDDIPAIGAQGQTQNGAVEAFGGHAYWLKGRLVDTSGNRSSAVELMYALEPDTVVPPPPPDTSATGILGRYYRGLNRNTFLSQRIDTTVAFSWGTASPWPGVVPADTFSVEWIGKVVLPTSGTWTFYVTSEDGARLSIDGTVRIDKLIVQPPTEWSATVTKAAGEHTLVLTYMARRGNSEVALRWSGPGVAKQIVPREALR